MFFFIQIFFVGGLWSLIFLLISEFCCESPSSDVDHRKTNKDHAYETEEAIGLASKVVVSSAINKSDTVCECKEESFDQSLIALSGNGQPQASNEEDVSVKIGESDMEVKGSVENQEEEEWEGIERSELERDFGRAVVFVGSKDNAPKVQRLKSDARLRLYGLHQVVIEGPCLVPRPVSLKVFARTKWNAWKQLGDMNRKAAMEQYINLLSESIPDWMGADSEEFADSKESRKLTNEILMAPLPDQLGDVDERHVQVRDKVKVKNNIQPIASITKMTSPGALQLPSASYEDK